MDFQGMRSSDYSGAGKAAADDTVRAHAAARRNAPKYGRMVQAMDNFRAGKKQAAIKVQSAVTKAGIQAAGDLKAHNTKLKAQDGLRNAKRKAGVLAAGGQLLAKGADAFKEAPKYESDSLDYSGQITKLREKASSYYDQVGQGGGSSDTTTDTKPDSPATPKGESGTSITTTPTAYKPPAPGKSLGKSELEQLAVAGGFSAGDAPLVAKIAMGESSGNPTAFNGKGADKSYGIMQINMLGDMGPSRRQEFGLKSNEDLYDPLTNMKAAYKIYKQQGWGAWGAYTNGSYSKF